MEGPPSGIICPDCSRLMNVLTSGEEEPVISCPGCDNLVTDTELISMAMSLDEEVGQRGNVTLEHIEAGREVNTGQYQLDEFIAEQFQESSLGNENRDEDVPAMSRTILDLIKHGEFYCSKCGGNEWEPLDGEDIKVFVCLSCDYIFGIQDTMNASDLERLIEEGLVRTELATSCQCGNNDANRFIIRDYGVVECLKCGSPISLAGNTDGSVDEEAAFQIDDSLEQSELSSTDAILECEGCRNSEYDLFEKFYSISGRLFSIRCLQCEMKTDLPAIPIECPNCGDQPNQEFNKSFDDTHDGWYVECKRCSKVFFHPLGIEQHTDVDSCGGAAVGGYAQVSNDLPGKHIRPQDSAGKCCSGRCGQKWNRQRVTSIDQLRVGDHISFRECLYWHHAIVVGIKPLARCPISVIHYSGDAIKLDGNFASVRREDLAVNLDKNEMYVHVYDTGSEYSPEEVISRAESRLGENKYNFLKNNCEHFASWCKIGVETCGQVKDGIVKAVKILGGSVINKLPYEIAAGSGVVQALKASRSLAKTPEIAASSGVVQALKAPLTVRYAHCMKESAKRIGGCFTKGGIKTGALVGSIALNLITEGAVFGYCAWSVYNQYKNRHISWADFKKELVKVGGECSGGFVGGTIGGIIGQIFIPVPFLGGFVGMLVGSVIGRFLGGLAGKAIGERVYKKEI